MNNNQQKLLSICVPTYNRDWCLNELIGVLKEEISDEIKNSIEVIFSDNCSSDETQKILQEFEGENKYVRYYRNDENIGFGRNYLKVVSHATGLFTWVLGDDDLPVKGAIKKLLEVIKKRNDDIILFNFVQKDLYMNNRIKDYIALSGSKSEFALSDDIELIEYLKSAQYSSVLFSYISCYIFKTLFFSKNSVVEKYENHPFIHQFYIWSSRNTHLNLFYISENLVFNRSGNDRISDNLYEISNIFMSGILDLCDEIFSNNTTIYNSVLQVSKNFDIPCGEQWIIKLIKSINKRDFLKLIKLVRKFRYSRKFILFLYFKKIYYFLRKIT